jgi:hypothetical protein
MEIGGKNCFTIGIAHCGINYNQKKNQKTTRRKILTTQKNDTFFIFGCNFLVTRPSYVQKQLQTKKHKNESINFTRRRSLRRDGLGNINVLRQL